jgi:hypothetical protein
LPAVEAGFSLLLGGLSVAGSTLLSWGARLLPAVEAGFSLLLGGLSVAGSTLLSWGARLLPMLIGAGEVLVASLTTGFATVLSAFEGVGTLLLGAGELLAGGIAGIAAVVGLPFEAIIGIVAGIGASLWAIWNYWDDIVDVFKKGWNNVTGWFDDLGKWMSNSWLGRLFGMSDNSGSANTNSSSTNLNSANSGSANTNSSSTNLNSANLASNTQSSLNSYPVDSGQTGSGAELINIQTAAVDQSGSKNSALAANQKKSNDLLERLVSSNEVGLSLQSRSVSIQDTTNKFAKQTAMAAQSSA